MARRVHPLTGSDLEQVPERCQSCLFWELGHPRPDARTHDDELAGDAQMQKQAWCTAQVLEDRPPGRVVRVDGATAGYVLFAPARAFAPRREPVPRASEDALLLATMWVEPAFRTRGIGRVLVQSAVKEAVHRGLTAVEAYGDRRWRESECVLPVTWLLHEGFEVATEHPRYPLLRLDARRTVRWAEALEHAVEEVLDLLPRRAPAPVPDGMPEVRRTTYSGIARRKTGDDGHVHQHRGDDGEVP